MDAREAAKQILVDAAKRTDVQALPALAVANAMLDIIAAILVKNGVTRADIVARALAAAEAEMDGEQD